jgi:site-specific recombinase XerD
MTTAMQMHGFSPRTHQSDLAAVADLAKYHRRAPDALAPADLKRYFEHLVVERRLAPASVSLAYNGIRCLYRTVVGWPAVDLEMTLPKRPQRIPELLAREEVAAILGACTNPRHRIMLELTYGCGLRLGEVLALRVAEFDGERRLLRIRRGKGGKDRLVPLSPTVPERLRGYWCKRRPRDWRFPGPSDNALTPTVLQKAYTHAKRAARIAQDGGIHSLRHASATHQLAAGLQVERLQRLLGHSDIRTTLRYVHWLPSAAEGEGALDLLAKLETGHG